MWNIVIAVAIALMGGMVIAALIRNYLHTQELARDAEDEARRRAADTAVFTRPPDFPETESETTGDVTEMVEHGPRRTWVSSQMSRLDGLRRDRRKLSDDATRVLAPLVELTDPSWTQDTGLMPLVTRAELMKDPEHPARVLLDDTERWRLQRPVKVTDELGEWVPSAHEQVEPHIMGSVLMWRKWKTVRPSDVGMGPR